MKKYSGKLLTPLAKKIAVIPANFLTICSFLSCIVVAVSFSYNSLIIGIIFLFLIEFFDQLDGIVARIQGPTKFGAFLDSTLDRYGDAAIFIGLFLGEYSPAIYILFAFIGAFLTSYTRARIESLGISSLGGIGLLERTDRIPVLFFGAILQLWIASALFWIVIILIVGSHITAIQRILFANNHLSKLYQPSMND